MAIKLMPFSSKTVLFLCLFLFFNCFITVTLSANNLAADGQALLAFKAAIVSDPLGSLSSWNETVDYCTWRGVTCSQRHRDRVAAINLISQGLVGSLSPYLGNLTFLRRITLKNNSFHGQIPEEIGRLRRLEYLELNNNSFGGEIPQNISQCKNLYYLNLIDNKLTGRIIPEIGSLVRLQALGLTTNRFSGTIPPWIGNLTSLNILSMANCGLEGQIPESLVHLRNLSWLQLSENSLTGTIPPGLFNSSTILFSMRSNRLHGTIPRDVGFTLTNIRNLDLGNNNFSGQIPASLSNASSLEAINLSSNNFTGPILKNFERLTNFRILYLTDNSFSGDFGFISTMTNCTKLDVIAVGANLLNGSLPDSIANLSTQLTYLSLGNNKMHGRIPSGIEYLVNLKQLNLRNNSLSGPIPSSIGKLVKLQDLYLDANELTGGIPPSLGNLSLLSHLFLGYNNISGTIPHSVNNFPNLLTFDLSHNNLIGEIPQEVLSLSSVSISFSLAYNELTGAIPVEVGLLRNLGVLDLSNNRLSGAIPNAVSRCVGLERLHLEGNSFEGEIPMGLNALRGLQDLDLSRNHLSGSIPNFLGDLHLLNLNLSYNELHGQIPTSGVFQNKSRISIDGNIDLCGGVPELRLQSCLTSNSRKGNVSMVLKIIVPIGVICLVLVPFLFVHMYKRKLSRRSQTPMPLFDVNFMRLSYADLLKATDEFSNGNLIGAGQFGSVYKGKLNDGRTTVAVKILNLDVVGASKTFLAECNALRRVRHRNLVKILSVCLSTDFQSRDFWGLVYEFKSNGSLEEWLHCKSDKEGEKTRNLTMIQRLSIAIDIASALEYLHFGTDATIIHGDLKPSNILLADNMVAYVSDFGLAKVVSKISAELAINESGSIAIKGTIGYIAPEYGMGDKVSTYGDAYSFGILLLEMFMKIRPTNEAFRGQLNLHGYASNALPDAMLDILDPSIVQEIEVSDGNKAKESMLSVLEIGVACSNEVPGDRMTMADVVTELKKTRSTYLSERMSQTLNG